MSINNFFLSRFTKVPSEDLSNLSVREKYRSLSIVYLCLFQILICILYNLYCVLVKPLTSQPVAMVCIFFMAASLFLIHRGKEHASVTAVLTGYHTGFLMAGFMYDSSIGILLANNLMPSIGSLITSSPRLQTINLVLCFAQNIANALRINSVFNIFPSQEQEREIMSMQIFASCTLATHWMHSYLNNHIETLLIHKAEINHEKKENIAKELVQVVSTQDLMVTHLSREMNPSLDALKN